MSLQAKREEVEALRGRLRELEADLEVEETLVVKPPLHVYTAYDVAAGCLLGIFGAMASLLLNILGSLVAGKNALELIRVYLTFPLGENALRLADGGSGLYAVSDGVILALGCCLYLLTGMLLGIPVYLALRWFSDRSSVVQRLIVAGVGSIVIWTINFYAVLIWLQPLLFGGSWIVDGRWLPWWVAAATHLVFGATIALMYPLGRFTPYRRFTVTD